MTAEERRCKSLEFAIRSKAVSDKAPDIVLKAQTFEQYLAGTGVASKASPKGGRKQAAEKG